MQQPQQQNSNKAVLLDRDGTIIHDRPGRYLSKPENLKLYKNSVPALKLLAGAGFKLFIVSNQSGIGRGYFTKQTVDEINAHMTRLLKKDGIVISGIYYCPHAPGQNCQCRKPAPQMGKQIIKEHGIDPLKSYMIGDKLSDIKFGKALGLKTVFVKTGNGRSQLEKYKTISADKNAANILDGARWILNNEIQN